MNLLSYLTKYSTTAILVLEIRVFQSRKLSKDLMTLHKWMPIYTLE